MSHDCTEQSPHFFSRTGKETDQLSRTDRASPAARRERKPVKKLLRDLVNSGEIIKNRKGLYGLPGEMSLVTGYFEAHRDGYGFVISEKPGERDVFVAGRNTLGAMDNDRVVVRIENTERRDGTIVRILDRAHTRVVGTLQVSRRASYVVPKNRSIPFDLYIAPDDRASAQDGDSVIVEVLSFPTDKRPPAGRVVKVLAEPKTPRDEVEGLIDEFHLPRRFLMTCWKRRGRFMPRHCRMRMRRTCAAAQRFADAEHRYIDGEKAKDF